MLELKDKSDIELYKLFINGDNEAFNDLVVRYRKLLINFILGYVHNYDIAEDLAQDTFLYLLINKPNYDFQYSLKTYLYTIAKSRAKNYLKHQKNRNKLDKFSLNEIVEIDFEKNIIQSENQKIVREKIKELKPNYQIVLYLRDYENFSYKQIGKIISKNIYSTKMLIYRARQTLKKIIEKGGYKYEE